MNEHNKQTWFSASDKPIKNKGYFHTHDSFDSVAKMKSVFKMSTLEKGNIPPIEIASTRI